MLGGLAEAAQVGDDDDGGARDQRNDLSVIGA
jgi:hypothetical protein